MPIPQSNPKTDRRVVKTRTALREAMMFLMGEQGWDDLSIQSICDKADIGRSTFYLHFSSKNDLLLQSLGEFRDGLIANTADSSTSPVIDILKGILEHMVEQLPIFKKIIGRRSSLIVATNFRIMLTELIELDLKRHQHPAINSPWLIRFLAGGIQETMAWWVDSPQPCSIQELENQLSAVISSALNQTRSKQ